MRIADIVKRDIILNLKTLSPMYYSAFAEGFLRGNAELTLSREGLLLTMTFDNVALAEVMGNLLLKLGADGIVVKKHQKSENDDKFYVTLEADVASSSAILKKCGITDGGTELLDGLSSFVKEDVNASLVFLQGLFMATGRLSVPKNDKQTKQGYHLEMVLTSEYVCDQVIELLNATGLCRRASKVKRQYNHSVYIKSMEDISDFIAAMQSSEGVLKLQEIIVERETRNRVNRSSNCSIANVDKTVRAGSEMLLYINVIKDKIGLDTLTPQLKNAAIARLDNPELSLAELLGVMPEKVSRSGLQHRLDKIKQIAQDLLGKEEKL